LGKIKDISRGGLAFEYLYNKGCKEDPSGIDIFLSGNRFYLPKLPCKVAYDFHLGEDLIYISAFHDRRCGVQFGEFTEKQERKLKLFLNNHITGTA